jgi:hypothetical protein
MLQARVIPIKRAKTKPIAECLLQRFMCNPPPQETNVQSALNACEGCLLRFAFLRLLHGISDQKTQGEMPSYF